MKQELFNLRVQKITSGSVQKSRNLKTVKKNIARILTVIQENKLRDAKKNFEDKKFIPKVLRKKKTKKLRNCLKPEQRNKLSVRQQKVRDNFPLRMYALKM